MSSRRPPEKGRAMGKEIPWSFAKIRSGEQLNLKGRGFTNVASLIAAGITAAKNPGAFIYLSAGGTGSVPCLAFQRRGEPEAGRHRRQLHLSARHEWPLSHHPARATSAASVGRSSRAGGAEGQHCRRHHLKRRWRSLRRPCTPALPGEGRDRQAAAVVGHGRIQPAARQAAVPELPRHLHSRFGRDVSGPVPHPEGFGSYSRGFRARPCYTRARK